MSRRTLAALAATLLLGAALRFYRPGRESLWIDEVLSVDVARQPWPALLAATGGDGHPPLYVAALHVWTRLFGEGDATVRVLSGLFGWATLPAFFALGRRLSGTRAALVSVLLLACCPYHVYYSQEARNYALLVLLTVLSWLALLAWDEEPRGMRAAAYVLATVLLLYTHVFAFFVWAAQILWIAFRVRTRGGLRARVIPLAAIALLVLPWAAAPWTQMLRRQVSSATTGLHLDRPTLWSLLMSAYQFAGSPLAAAVLLPSASLEAYRSLRAGGRPDEDATGGALGPRDRAVLLLVWALLPQVVPFALSQVTVPVYITRATIVTLPPLLLLAGGFLARLRALAAGALLSLAVLSSLWAQALYFRLPSKEQWREVAAAVDARAREGDLAVFDAGYGERGFDHYSRTSLLRKLGVANDLASPPGAVERGGVLSSGAPRLWLIRFQRAPARDALLAAFARDYRLAGAGSYTGIEVLLLERTAQP